jgi:NADH dehydrogenase FAD-containing subunit
MSRQIFLGGGRQPWLHIQPAHSIADSMFDESMRHYASKTLKEEHIDIYTNHHVDRVEPVRLSNKCLD